MYRDHKERELAEMRAKLSKRLPETQLTLEESVKRMRERCTHDFVRVFPSGPRDNGEYRHVCRLCNAARE